MRYWRYWVGLALANAGLGILTAGFMIPFGIFCFQIYSWLRFAEWPSFPVSIAFDYLEAPRPDTSWLGVAAILDWLFNLPIGVVALTLAPIGLVVHLVGTAFQGPPPPPPPLPQYWSR